MEDPLLVGNLGYHTIKGLQLDDFVGEKKVLACAKHFIAGSDQEMDLIFVQWIYLIEVYVKYI